jgi:hypothetical protein
MCRLLFCCPNKNPSERIEIGETYNLTKSEDSRQPKCPEEKEKAIMLALKYFGMF